MFAQNLEVLGVPKKPGFVGSKAVQQLNTQLKIFFCLADYVRKRAAAKIPQYRLNPVLDKRISRRWKAQPVFPVEVQAKITDFSCAEAITHLAYFLERLGAAWKNPSRNYLPGRPHLPANFGVALLTHEPFGVLKLEITYVLDIELLYLKAQRTSVFHNISVECHFSTVLARVQYLRTRYILLHSQRCLSTR